MLRTLCILSILTAFLHPFVALATDTSKINDIIVTLTATVKSLISLAFLAAVMVFSWGVVKFIASASQGGEAVKKAKGILVWGIVGMAVMASIVGLITFLQLFFGVEGGGTIQILQFGEVQLGR